MDYWYGHGIQIFWYVQDMISLQYWKKLGKLTLGRWPRSTLSIIAQLSGCELTLTLQCVLTLLPDLRTVQSMPARYNTNRFQWKKENSMHLPMIMSVPIGYCFVLWRLGSSVPKCSVSWKYCLQNCSNI